MGNLSIILRKSVNGIPFFTKKADVRAILGDPDYSSTEDIVEECEVQRAKKLLEIAIKETYQEMGKDPDSFEWPDISQYQSDLDTYGQYQLEYDREQRLVSVNLITEYNTRFVIEGKDFSDFDLKKILSLANDFVIEEEGCSYVSRSKQIGIWCPNADGKIESIVFGSEGYFE